MNINDPAFASHTPNSVDLARMFARQQIELALSDYAIGVDDRDQDRWLAAFHDDATFDCDFPLALLHGHKEILAWTQAVWRFKALSHLTGNHRIDFVSESDATGIGHAIGIFVMEDGVVTVGCARYQDHYQKRDDVWRLSYRKTRIVSSFAVNDSTTLMLNGNYLPGVTVK